MNESGSDEATASAVISFVERLETDSSRFYREMADKYTKNKETFLKFAKECEKSRTLVTRTYQETITDALEACFSFKGLRLSDLHIKAVLSEKVIYTDDLKTALKLEERVVEFYVSAAERSGQLLATIPRAFKKAAETRSRRISELKEIVKASTGSLKD